MKKKIAIVSQRYGTEVVGGAEGLAKELAENMRDLWDVTVITTCAKDYRTWENVYPEGKEEVNGVSVLRFPVDKARDFAEFSKSSFNTESKAFRLTEDQEKQYFEDQGPFCPKLIQFLEDSYDKFDAFIFMTYLYYTTVAGVPKVADKAYLISTAHDEPPFYLARTYSKIFSSLKGLIYLAEEEKALLNKVYQIPSTVRQIAGSYGVPKPVPYTAAQEQEARKKYAFLNEGEYFIYVGRASVTKRCHELMDAYQFMTHDYNIKSKLVFVGVMDLEIPEHRKDIVSVGYATEMEKSIFLNNAVALVNPSSLESLSMVVLEAWMHELPVIVNGESTVMRGLCDRSGGGVYYHSNAMLKGLMAWTLSHGRERNLLGLYGKQYVEQNYSWDRVKKNLLKNIQ
jgi:glycosyltransferase involved in cell wall biosynthesis